MNNIEREKLHARIAELERKAKLLEKSEERLELALAGTGLGLWDWNVQTNEVIFNDTWGEMLGYDPGEITPNLEAWSSRVHPEDMPEILKKLNDHLAGKTPYYESKHRLRRKDGSWEWILDRGKVVEWNKEGKPLRATGTHRKITKEKEFEIELEHNAHHDPLTQLPNRRSLEKDFNVEAKKAERHNRLMALLYVDIDCFKSVNDELGHKAGDMLLKKLSVDFKSILREEEKAYRVGGDEFCFLVPEFTHREQIEILSKRLINKISEINSLEGMQVDIGGSIGIALFPDNGKTLSELTSAADRAMYAVKSSQKNDFCFAD